MTKFTPGQRIRAKVTHEDLGTVEWHSGRVVRNEAGLHLLARDIELMPDVEGEAPAHPLGDLCPTEGGVITDAAVLVGRNLKLVWKVEPVRRGQNLANSARVELRRLDGGYVTTVAIGNVTPGHLMLAMPYLEEHYGERSDDWALAEGTFEELPAEGGDDHEQART